MSPFQLWNDISLRPCLATQIPYARRCDRAESAQIAASSLSGGAGGGWRVSSGAEDEGF